MLVRGNKGFTLIELLIVIAIIVILAAVLIPNLLGARARGQITAAVAELRGIATAMETWSVDKGRYVNLTTDIPANHELVTLYLGGKDPKVPWDKTSRILATYASASPDFMEYNITISIPDGLKPAARLLSGVTNVTRIFLSHDKGVEFLPEP